MTDWKPKITTFLCNWCSYGAADLAGVSRFQYPSNIRVIRVPCSGKVDAMHVVKAFEKGADGVYVAGCLEGDCHFKNGNTKAARMVAYVRRYMDEIGIEPERLEMVTMSAGMGYRFAQVATEITDKIRRMGPSPIHAAIETGKAA